MRLCGHDLDIVSVGGLETCVQLPGWDACFDIGRCPPGAVQRSRVFLTHAHMDHAGGLAYHAATRDLYGHAAPTYYVPRDNVADVEALLEVWRRLDRSEIPAHVVGVGPGDEIALGSRRFARPFQAHHRVYCQGYALGERRKHLRPELRGLDPREIERRRLAGEDVSAPHESIEVAFCGDTTADVLTQPLVQAARLLILECTFVGDDVPPAKAHAKGHVHLRDLAAHADLLPQEHILLTHFSQRYGRADVLAALDRVLPADLRARTSALPEHEPSVPA